MLRVDGINKSFRRLPVLKDITFEISAGESILLLGANGAGKSTLIKIILNLLQQDHGKMDWSETRPKIGYVPQTPSIMNNLTVRQFTVYILSLHGKRTQVNTVLKDAGLESKEKALAENLSSGQMKRLLFQLAVAAKPKLLIMDEPTAGMDVEAKRLFRKQLSAVRADGVSVLVTTHILPDAENLADRLIYLEEGVLKVDRTINEIRQLRQLISFRTDEQHKDLLLSMGYVLQEDVYRKRTDDADREMHILIQKKIHLKQLEIKKDTLEKYVEGLSKEGAGL
ncbi:ABC transporter ATP-binding protein [Terribacillus saccharophilus]|uniref:ABC transporter ATP-binding protein n=1 Tax=Terribacillus saccharophilus TaxID=361277 RepID=UPI0039820B33